MAIINDLFTFFGISALADTATFTDLIFLLLKIGCGMWFTIFVIRSLFLCADVGNRSFF